MKRLVTTAIIASVLATLTAAVLVPGVGDVTLSSPPSGGYLTTDDLEVGYTLTGDATTASIAWQRDGVPHAALLMPFEGGAAGALSDRSGHGAVAVTEGTPVWSASGGYEGTGAFEFDGDTDGIRVSDAAVFDVDHVTLAAWVYLDSLRDDARIISKEYGTVQPYSIYTMSIGTPGENLYNEDHLEMRIGLEGQNRIRFQSAAAIPTGAWTHIATSFDGAAMRLYIDGVLDTTYAASGVLRKNDEPVYIGQSGFYDRPPQGWIDDARVYGYALSDAQILALATRGPGVIVAAETAVGEQWFAEVTPFSATTAGPPVSTDTVTIASTTPTPLVRIMPLGNSITYDNNSGDTRPSSIRTGYRQPLWRMLVSSCYNVDFVGNVVAGESAVPSFDPDNEGHPGWTDSQIRDNIYNWLDTAPADVILLHIGTNALDTSETEVMQILDEIDRWEDDNAQPITVLLARIINRASYSSTTTTFNDNVEAAALDRVNNPSNPAYPDDIVMVDMEDGAGIDYSADMQDSLHPNHRGYQKMAALWFQHLEAVLPGPDTACSSCPEGLTHHWPMDTSVLSPYTVTQHPDDARASNGECATCPVDAAGTVAGAQSFDGADGVDVTDDDVFDWAADQSFSIEYWMKTSASTSGNRVILGRDDASTSLHWWTGPDDNGTVRFQLRDVTGGGAYLGGTGPVLNDGAWHHVVCVRDEATDSNKVYVDAALIDAAVYDYTASFASDKSLNIGWLDLGGQYRYEGLLDEVALYNRALTHAEVLAHRDNGLAGIGVCDVAPVPSAPLITSAPVTSGAVGVPYSYDVNASGIPAPTYALLTAPAGMSIDPDTGVISWVPAPGQAGPNAVTVEASNSEGTDTQSFTVTVAAQEPDVRVMPLGDSITRGVFGDPDNAGYRRPLYLQLQSAACNVDLVGQLSDGVPDDFDKDHEGRDGERDDEVAANVYGYLDLNPADVVLLHIGTNALDTSEGDVENILDEIDRWEADNSAVVHVLLARIINRYPYSATTTQFNDNVEAMALDRVTNPANDAYPDHIVMVDMEDGAGIDYAADMADGVHPNPTGYAKMAGLWFTYLDSLYCGVNASDVALTSTSGDELDTDDLTATFGLSAEATTAAVAWYRSASPPAPVMTLYLPMEGGAAAALADRSGNGFDATPDGAPAWNATAGHDGHGAWVFGGTDGLLAGEHFPVGSSYTKTAWVYRTGSGANGGNNIISGDENTGGHALWAPDSYGNKLSAGHNYHWNIVQDDVALPLNTWVHVALSYDAATYVMKLYKNGAVVDTAVVDTADRAVTDPTIAVGCFGTNGFRWDGTIDDARIWNRALTPEQIALLAAGTIDAIKHTETSVGDQWMAEVTPFSDTEAGEARQSNTVTIQPSTPTAPVIVSVPDTTATAGVPYSYDVDASGSPVPTYALTTSPDGMTIDPGTGVISWVPAAAGTVSVVVEASNSEGADSQHFDIVVSPYAGPAAANVDLASTSGNDLTTDELTVTYDLQGGAVTAATAWYRGGVPLEPLMDLFLPMEGGATEALADYSGNGFDAVTHGDPVWNATAGHDGHGAWVFDGAGDDLAAGEHFPTGSSYTKTAWVYRTGSGANGGNNIISGDENTGGHAFWAPDSYGNRLSGGHNYNWDIVQDGVALALDTWYHVALSYNAATYVMKLYKNGVAVDTAVVDSADRAVTDATISIGSFGASNGYMWQGTIDDARIWNRALSPQQIASLYSAGADVIVPAETADGDHWAADVTPFSSSEAGMTVRSDTLTVGAQPSAPVITSIPDTTATVGALYEYDVNATGVPAPVYHLVTFPSGMAIDSTSGLIAWTPAEAGTAGVQVEAVNGAGSDVQSFDIVVDTYAGPVVTGLALTSTSGYGLAGDDLTVTFGLGGGATRSATAWYGPASPPAPLMALYLPMEGGAAEALADYSGNGFDAVTHGDPVWSATGGHDGGGAWVFDGNGDDLSAGEHFPAGSSYTKTAWVYRTGSGANGGNNIVSGDANAGGHAFWAPDMYGNKLSGGHNGHWDIVQDDVALTLDAWHFVALSYDAGTYTMKLYRDGAVVDSALVASADRAVTDPTISIGSFGASNGWMWQGTIDDARIWNRVLSNAQIASLYTSGANVITAGETAAGDHWAAAVTPFTDTGAGPTAHTDTLTIIESMPPGLSEAPAIASTSGDHRDADTLSVTYTLSGGAVTAGVAWYTGSSPMAPVLSLYLPFEGAATALTDYSGNGHTAVPTGDPAWGAGAGHDGFGAFVFDGGDDDLDCGESFPAGGSYTKTAWVYRAGSGSGGGNAILCGDAYGGGHGLWAPDFAGTRLAAGHDFDWTAVQDDTALPLNTWVFVAVSFDHTTGAMKLYRDGAVVDSAAVSGAVTDSTVSVGSFGAANGQNWNGTIDDVRVYAHALSGAQVAALYSHGGDMVVPEETAAGQTWMAEVTPFSPYAAGSTARSDTVTVLDDATAIRSGVPSRVALYQNVPNPFNPTTAIEFFVPVASPVSLTVYDVRGRRVATLFDRDTPEGFHRVVWDGVNARGEQVSTGVYFYRLVAGSEVRTKKMVLVK